MLSERLQGGFGALLAKAPEFSGEPCFVLSTVAQSPSTHFAGLPRNCSVVVESLLKIRVIRPHRPVPDELTSGTSVKS